MAENKERKTFVTREQKVVDGKTSSDEIVIQTSTKIHRFSLDEAQQILEQLPEKLNG